MNKALLASTVAVCASLSSVSAHAKDPCATVLCMFGMVMGQSTSACDSAIEDYFSIVEMHNGHPDLSATPKAREAFMNQCTSAPASYVSSINGMFGSTIK